MPQGEDEDAASVDQTLARLNVKINPYTATALRDVCGRKQISFTEAIRQAIAVWRFMEDAIFRGASVQIVEPDGSRSQILIP